MIYTADFDGQQAADHTLLVGVGTATHALAVVDRRQQLKFAAHYDPATPEAEIEELLGLAFGAVKLAVSDSRYTFIPADIYDDQYRDTYLRYLPYDGIGDVAVADIQPLGVKMLHQTSRLGTESTIARFPQADSYPATQALLSAVAGPGMKTNAPFVVIDRHSPWTTIAVFDDGRFMYCRDFEGDHLDDFTYHLGSVVRGCGLDGKRPSVCLSGDIGPGDAYFERAAAYGGEAVLADSGSLTGITVPAAFAPHQHRFLTLFGLHQCG